MPLSGTIEKLRDIIGKFMEGGAVAGNIAQPGESVAHRLFSILDAYDVAHPELSLTEIARRSGLPLSTAKRLIAELVQWGGLERLVDNKYRIGIRLWTIGALAPQQRGLREIAVPLMHDLAQATNENVQLVIPTGQVALCIEKISSRSAVPSETEIGGHLPLHATAVGKCLLAFSPRDLLVQVVDRGLERRTKHTVVQPGKLGRELREVRRTGTAFSREEMTLGVISAASPIIAPGGLLRGALGVVAHSPGQLETLAPAVRMAALTISRSCR